MVCELYGSLEKKLLKRWSNLLHCGKAVYWQPFFFAEFLYSGPRKVLDAFEVKRQPWKWVPRKQSSGLYGPYSSRKREKAG